MAAKNSGGFGASAIAPADDSTSTLSAIPLADLKIEEIELHDLGNTLPVGIICGDECLKDFTLNPYSADYEIALGRLVEANTDREGNLKDPVKVIKEFLPLVINTIGGQPLKDLARNLSTSTSRLIEGMYWGDVTTLFLALRLQAQGFEIAMAAKCPKCGTLAEDNPKKGRSYHDLSSVTIKVIRDLTQKPLIELTLPEGFKIFEDTITRLWLEPLKLYQFDRLLKSTSGNPKDMDQIYQMVVGIPDSEAYRNVRGQVFDESIYRALCSSPNGRVSPNKNALYKAVNKIQPGPAMWIEMDCVNPMCKNAWEQPLPWLSFREFLYFSADSDD